MVDGKDFSRIESILAVILIALFSAVIGVSVSSLTGYIDIQRVSTALSGLAAAGTLLLAGATFYTVRQNRKELTEVQKDRQRPLVVDEISNVVEPSIEILRANAEYLDSKPKERWHYHDSLDQTRFSEDPKSLFSGRHFDPVSIARLGEEAPGLIVRMEAHDWFIDYLSKLSDRIADQVDDDVERIFEDSRHTDGIEYESERLVILSSMMKQTDRFGKNHKLYDFWEEKGEELNRLSRKEADDLYMELDEGEDLLLEYSKELYEDLIDRRRNLQGEYGISKSDFESDIDLIPGL